MKPKFCPGSPKDTFIAAARLEDATASENGTTDVSPLNSTAKRSPSGGLRITFIADDFDAPDDEIVQLFEGE